MTNEQKLLALGAESVGGDLILRHKVAGRYRNGDFFVTEDGLKMLQAESVEDATVVPAVEPAAPKQAKKAKKAEKPAEAPVEADESLLAGLDEALKVE